MEFMEKKVCRAFSLKHSPNQMRISSLKIPGLYNLIEIDGTICYEAGIFTFSIHLVRW
jgi:hypothetical protein